MDTTQSIDIKQLQSLIYETVRNAVMDVLEDKEAIESNNYINSIEEARKDYQNGNIVDIKDLNV